jgi:ankyrin repeat protein
LLRQAGCGVQLETSNGRTAVDVATERWGLQHEVTQLLLLLQDGGTTTTATSHEGQQPTKSNIVYTPHELRTAAGVGQRDRVIQILAQHPEYINEPDPNGWAAIHLATRAGHTSTVEYLKSEKANLMLETKSGHTPIRLAYERLGEDHAITKLLQEALPHNQGHQVVLDASHVRMAAQSGDLSRLTALLQTRPDFVNAADANGWTALHLAARAGHAAVVTFLMEHHQPEVSLVTATGRTALDIAQQQKIRTAGHEEVIRLLLLAQQEAS